MHLPPPISPLFPYTTLFRSNARRWERIFWGFDNTGNDVLQERSEEHTSELQSRGHLVCRLLLEKKKKIFSTSFPAETSSPHSPSPRDSFPAPAAGPTPPSAQ